LKRKYSDLQDRELVFERLYTLIRDRPKDEAATILLRIRNGFEPEAILSDWENSSLLLQLHLKPETNLRYDFPYIMEMPEFIIDSQSPYLLSTVFEWSVMRFSQASGPKSRPQAVYLKPYHAAKLVEPLLDECNISKWTNVKLSEELLHDLMESYFLHNYPFFNFFHKDYFLRDLKHNRRRFCSELLVNAILAGSCHSCRRIANRNEFWNPINPAYFFIAETRRLLEAETGKNKITTIQALLVINMMINEHGTDKIGNMYLDKAVQMAKALGLFGAPTPSKSVAMQNVRGLTAWSLFGFQA
jgi:hypothetical protein